MTVLDPASYVTLDRAEVVAALQALHDIKNMRGRWRNSRADQMADRAAKAVMRFNTYALVGTEAEREAQRMGASDGD